MPAVLSTLLAAPQGDGLRRVEHLVFLVVFFAAVRWLRRKGLKGALKSVLTAVVNRATKLPGVAGVVEKELQKEVAKLETQILGDGDAQANLVLPKQGMGKDDVIAMQRGLLEQSAEARSSGRKWGGVYYVNKDLSKCHAETWAMHSSTNCLFPGTFPSLRKYEAEVVAMVLSLVHGHEHGAVGLLASGGTESILLATLGYRNAAREKGITDPEVLCAVTAHPAISKACHYFGIRQTKLPVDPKTFTLRPETVRAAMNPNVVMVYASAPTFTHGVVDPIEELGQLALEKGVGLHVDNCLGGFLLSFLQRAGHFKRGFTFAVPGVTTMSIDVHKYGFASKGASVVAFRDPEMRQATYVPSCDGCEGLYVTPTIQGSRNGANVAVAWSTLMMMGEEGYQEVAGRLHRAGEKVKEIIADIPSLALLTQPDAAIVPLHSTDPALNIYQVAWQMEKKGWNLFTGQNPPCMSMCLGEQTTDRLLDVWGSDLKDSLQHIREHPEDKEIGGTAGVYGAASTTPPQIMDQLMRRYVDMTLRVKPMTTQAP